MADKLISTFADPKLSRHAKVIQTDAGLFWVLEFLRGVQHNARKYPDKASAKAAALQFVKG